MRMVDVVVDVEADGPCPGLYSMISLGAVVCAPGSLRSYHLSVRPISERFNEAAMAVSSTTRSKHLTFPRPEDAIPKFCDWVKSLKGGRPVMWSDNPAFDWQWVNYYLHRYAGENPFGHSARRIGDLYCGIKLDLHARWKHLRDTKHTHNPVDDATANAEALLKIMETIRQARG